MKKSILIIPFLTVAFLLINNSSSIAQTKVFIPDTNFKNHLNSTYPTFMDVSGDSLITDSAATFTGTLNCNSLSIADLTGAEYFINMTSLDCSDNLLTTLPNLSNITTLEYLTCDNNQISALPNLTSNTALILLRCNDNQLIALPDLTSNAALKYFYCDNNQLTSLPDFTSNPILTYLDCSYNALTVLPNLTNNTFLQYLGCSYTQLTVLPSLDSNYALYWLACDGNQLTTLPDISGTAMVLLHCQNNQLTALPDLSTNLGLQQLYCQNNQLTVLPNLSTNTNLIDLWCHNNLLTTLPDLTSNTALEKLYCYNNKLSVLPDLTVNTSLQSLWCNNNKYDFSDARTLRLADNMPSVGFHIFAPQNPFGDSATHNLTVGDNISLSISTQDSALSYQWFKGTDSIVGATDTVLVIPNITLADSGIYTCQSYGTALLSPPMTFGGISEFVSEPFTVIVSLTIGITDNPFEADFKVYPNPAKNNITLDLGTNFNKTTLTILNVKGQIIESYSFRKKQVISVNIENYATGLYLFKIDADDQEATIRIIK